MPLEKIEQESKRAAAMVGVADQILRTAAVQIQAAKMVTDFDGRDPSPYLSSMRDKSEVSQPLGGRTLTVVAGK